MYKFSIKFILCLFYFGITNSVSGQKSNVVITKKIDGFRLNVDGKPMIINGMNWDYFPIGTNYNYSLWTQPDRTVKAALDREMTLLKNMGINAIRVYAGMPARWIEYVYKNYGIYTMLNHSFGRYGLNVNGTWRANTDYANREVAQILLQETKALVQEYKDTPGLLLYLLGNENNYGLFWEGAETEDIPFEDRKSVKKAIPMYQLMNEAVKEIKSIDTDHPIAICNGDLLFLDLIVQHCPDIDILGTNMYRGISFTDAFTKVKSTLDKPILFTEFGSDAFNALSNEEDQIAQAEYFKNNWKEIYENSAGMGKSQNCLGGFTFQFSDGWWKYNQTSNLDVHDNNASWANGGYAFDYVKGDNNMNEEWFGICAKGAVNSQGLYDLYPRTSYYVLKDVHGFNPYAENTNLNVLQGHFSKINLAEAELKARADKAEFGNKQHKKINLSRIGIDLSTYNTGGDLVTTPKSPDSNNPVYPNKKGFDHMESFFVGVEANPSPNMRAKVEANILGNVALNPIDQIFYENRGRPVIVQTPTGRGTINSNNRVQIYNASYDWNHKFFNLKGFYRTGHYHWGYEGDFFGLYPEANYGPNIDIYNAAAPFGFEMEAKRKIEGLKVAFGPQLWWGANPAILVKYSKQISGNTLTAVLHEDLEQLTNTQSSFAVPQPKTRRATLHLSRQIGNLKLDLGGIWAGQPLQGRSFQLLRGDENNYKVYEDQIKSTDNWGGKIKLTLTANKINWYAQSSVMGLVAGGSQDPTQTFTGWRLKDSGSGNQYNFLTGLTYSVGKLQIAPNFLWQKPIEGPIPSGLGGASRPRNILSDPFVVRANRESVAGEILFTYDPTPATWMYEWNNDEVEDAKFALSAGFVYKHLPTTMDAAIGIFPDGRTTFAFDGAPPAMDLWEINSKIVSKFTSDNGLIINLYAGNAQANGSDSRTINRLGAEFRTILNKFKIQSFIKFNDWGPYDYHRDFNLTFPIQLMADLSYSLERPSWFLLPGTRIGMRGTYRSLDKYSPRYAPTYILDVNGDLVPDPNAIGFKNGNEWEIRTYISININN